MCLTVLLDINGVFSYLRANVRIATLPRSNLGKDTAGCRIGARVEAE